MKTGGVNLQRINKTHDLNNVTVANPITFDSYNVKLDMTEQFDQRMMIGAMMLVIPALYLSNTKSTGGYNVKATQNIPFEIITPIVQNVTTKEQVLVQS